MKLENVTLPEALKLLSLPRTLGAAGDDGEAVTAQNGKYGPYVKKGKETRSLDTEEQLFTITLDEALELLSRPKSSRRAARGPLRELGPDPLTGKEIVLKDGQFGPYVSDGEVNASLRKGDDPEKLSLQRASALLSERRSSAGGKSRSRSGGAKTKSGARGGRASGSQASASQSSGKRRRSGAGGSSGRQR